MNIKLYRKFSCFYQLLYSLRSSVFIVSLLLGNHLGGMEDALGWVEMLNFGCAELESDFHVNSVSNKFKVQAFGSPLSPELNRWKRADFLVLTTRLSRSVSLQCRIRVIVSPPFGFEVWLLFFVTVETTIIGSSCFFNT